MRKIKLTKEEQWIEDHAEEFVPVSREEFREMAEALAARRKDKVISIRLNSIDLEGIKQKAKKFGIKYQSYISEILHHAARA
jgi:predicted DNA binding CopG/RHH family protein